MFTLPRRIFLGIDSNNGNKERPPSKRSTYKKSKFNIVFEVMGKDGEEVEYLNASYSDTSLDDGGLSSSLLGMIKIQRRRCFIKGQVWTLVVIHPKPKVDKIIQLIGKIQD